ncbi:MAG: porin [Gammaproteobacteria bacterium]|nr:porin [Gammaproteobacteria bacterium]
MKKTILALTIPALFATSASAVTVYSDEGAQVDIYGRVQFEAGAQKYQTVKTDKAENFGGVGEARLGVNVKYMLNNDVDLIGKLEWQVTAEGENDTQTDDIDARYAWAGFRFMDTTDLTFGRVNSPYAQLLDYTDVLNVFGGIAAYGDTLGTTDKVDDMARVSYAANGLDLRAGYSFNDADKQDGNLAEEDRWSVSAGYTLPMGLGFGAAYEQIAFGNGADQDNWIAGVNYTLDGLYVAAIYTAQEKDAIGGKNETDGYELHAQYTVDAWTVLAQYSNEEYDAAGSTSTVDTVDAITLGAQYSLTPKAKLYAEYLINDIGDQDDLYGVGIQYNF